MRKVYIFAGLQLVILLTIIACQACQEAYPDYSIVTIITSHRDASPASAGD